MLESARRGVRRASGAESGKRQRYGFEQANAGRLARRRRPASSPARSRSARSAPSHGGTVCFPPGTYRRTDTIRVRTGINVVGTTGTRRAPPGRRSQERTLASHSHDDTGGRRPGALVADRLDEVKRCVMDGRVLRHPDVKPASCLIRETSIPHACCWSDGLCKGAAIVWSASDGSGR